MGVMTFQLPVSLADASLRQELERASVTGGQDNMPYPTEALVEPHRLIVTRCVDESGCLQTPWRMNGTGQLMTSSATLMERSSPYFLAIELARGKINQVRSQLADFTQGGLIIPDALTAQVREAIATFSRALMRLPEADAMTVAQQALEQGYAAANELLRLHSQRLLEYRHLRQTKLDTWQSCRLAGGAPSEAHTKAFLGAFNSVSIPFPWQSLEATQGQYNWTEVDKTVNWALSHGLKIIGGPLIDFSGRDLPPWLWEDTPELSNLANMLADHVEAVVRRYHTRIRSWQISAGSNWAGVLARRDEELIWLTLRLADAVRRVNPQLEVIVGIAQPWGDYLAEQERSRTPFTFADDLLRTGVKLAALELECIMGVAPRGSYCRDLLDVSRLLDLYILLGVPIQMTLGYPSALASGERADPDQRVGLGFWRGGYFEETQADWASSFATLALAKPYVRTVQWAHWSDAQPHEFPNCGLVDPQDRIKAAVQELAKLRTEHLK